MVYAKLPGALDQINGAKNIDICIEQRLGDRTANQALVDCYRRAAAGQPQLVVLRGEAGIGKTRLARVFLAWAGAQGAELLQGGAFESGSHLPFQVLVEALRFWLERENSPKDILEDVWLSLLSQLLPELRKCYTG